MIAVRNENACTASVPEASVPELLHCTLPQPGTTAAGDVRALLETHLAHESARTLRQFSVHLLAMLGGLAAACLLFPEVGSAAARQALLDMWVACLAFAVVVGLVEWRVRRAEARLLAADQRDVEHALRAR